MEAYRYNHTCSRALSWPGNAAMFSSSSTVAAFQETFLFAHDQREMSAGHVLRAQPLTVLPGFDFLNAGAQIRARVIRAFFRARRGRRLSPAPRAWTKVRSLNAQPRDRSPRIRHSVRVHRAVARTIGKGARKVMHLRYRSPRTCPSVRCNGAILGLCA